MEAIMRSAADAMKLDLMWAHLRLFEREESPLLFS